MCIKPGGRNLPAPVELLLPLTFNHLRQKLQEEHFTTWNRNHPWNLFTILIPLFARNHIHTSCHSTKIKMSAAGLSATSSASAGVYIPGPSSSSRRKSSTVSAIALHINRDFQHKFYIPGETPSGGPFPQCKNPPSSGHPSLIMESDVRLLEAGCGSPPEQVPREFPLSAVWSFVRGKVWGLVQNTFKKGKFTD